jgi:hypothetical protein
MNACIGPGRLPYFETLIIGVMLRSQRKIEYNPTNFTFYNKNNSKTA